MQSKNQIIIRQQGRVAELADALDSKSSDGNIVRVRLSPRPPTFEMIAYYRNIKKGDLYLDIFEIKKYLDNLTRGQGITKKIIFPKKFRDLAAMAIVEWHKNLYALYWLWKDKEDIFSAELLTCQKQPKIRFATIIFNHLAVKFKSPEEAGYGISIFNLDGIRTEKEILSSSFQAETKIAP